MRIVSAQSYFVLHGQDDLRKYCVRFVRRGFFFFQAEDGIRDHCVTGVQTCALPIYPLTERERDVFAAATGGASILEIASSLHLSEGTVRNYLSVAMQKLGAHNRIERSEERRVGKEGRSRGSPDH